MRHPSDQEALWRALALGDLQTVSSDHAPYRFDESGKFVNGVDPDFKAIPNGMPGVEARLPLLFDAMVSQGRLGLEKFVSLAATEPAKIYGLHPKKGEIIVGADADIAIWDPMRKVTFTTSLMHDRVGYTPYEGRTVTGWPVTVLSRGRVVIDDGTLRAAPGSGRFLPREAGAAAVPTGQRGPEFDPEQNFGARI